MKHEIEILVKRCHSIKYHTTSYFLFVPEQKIRGKQESSLTVGGVRCSQIKNFFGLSDKKANRLEDWLIKSAFPELKQIKKLRPFYNVLLRNETKIIKLKVNEKRLFNNN